MIVSQAGRSEALHTTQNSGQFKAYELFTSERFHLTFSDHSRLQVTELPESETADRGPLYQHSTHHAVSTSVPV